MPQINEPEDESQIDRRHWGELNSEDEESDQESEMDEDEDTGMAAPPTQVDTSYATSAQNDAGIVTPSGGTSTVLGIETPETIELRKKRVDERYVNQSLPSYDFRLISSYTQQLFLIKCLST